MDKPKLVGCQKAKCSSQYDASKAVSKKLNEETKQLMIQKEKNEITDDEFKQKLAEHRKKISSVFERKEYQDLFSCSLKNCYNEYKESLKFIEIVALIACHKDKASEKCRIGNRLRSKLKAASPLTLERVNDLLRELMKIMNAN